MIIYYFIQTKLARKKFCYKDFAKDTITGSGAVS